MKEERRAIKSILHHRVATERLVLTQQPKWRDPMRHLHKRRFSCQPGKPERVFVAVEKLHEESSVDVDTQMQSFPRFALVYEQLTTFKLKRARVIQLK